MDAIDELSSPQTERSPGVATRMMRARIEDRLFDTGEPVRIGRFRILERIGEGGMGTVWLAHDPQLDRRVALKLMRAASRSDAIVREARALARLTHPHVVTVFESGQFEGGVFVAMEYLDGGSLADWLRSHAVYNRAATRRTIEFFLAAGRGLAAAHDAGLVHRDFKPSNVLLGRDGRLKVADFGLARALGPARGATDPQVDPASCGPWASAESWSSQARGGTPAYMAPEQFDGLADERSDQFAFCVALWEALMGERPFAGVAIALREGDLLRRVVPRGRRVPRWMIRALQRGFALEPTRRWPTMHALVAALDPRPRALRRRALAIGTGAVVLATLLAWRPWAAASTACAARGDELVSAWTPERRAEIEQSFAALGSGLADETWARIDPLLVGYAARWERTRVESCEATLLLQTRTAEAYAATLRCLQQRRDAFGAMTAGLARADFEVAHHAVDAVEGLDPPEACAEADASEMPVESESAATAQELQRELNTATANLKLHRLELARSGLAAVAPRIEALARPDLLAHLRFAQGRRAFLVGELTEAEAHHRDALRFAARAGDDALLAASWPQLMFVLIEQGEPRRALELELAVRTALARIDDDANRAYEMSMALALAHTRTGRLDEAEAECTIALELIEGAGDARAGVAEALGCLADIELARGDVEAGLRLQQEAIGSLEARLGVDHPRVAAMRIGSVQLLRQLGRYRDAVTEHERALPVLEAKYGPASLNVADALVYAAPALARVDRLDDGMDALRRAVAIHARLGPSTGHAVALAHLGTLHDRQGHTREALEHFERAIAMLEQLPEADVRVLAQNVANAAALHATLGDVDVAHAGFERAIALFEQAFGPTHPLLAHPLVRLARLESRAGDHARAHALAARADRVQPVGSAPPDRVADGRFEHARCRWQAGLRDGEALRLAEEAEALAREGAAHELAAEIAAWRREHALGESRARVRTTMRTLRRVRDTTEP